MKEFEVEITQRLRIAFDDDRATEKSAAHVAQNCWGSRAIVGDAGISRNLGPWRCELLAAELGDVKGKGKGES